MLFETGTHLYRKHFEKSDYCQKYINKLVKLIKLKHIRILQKVGEQIFISS